MPASQDAPFHVGLTPERVVDAALHLTKESHLAAWSIRDLAGRLGVAPSVVYHHVGGKDLLGRRVVERVLAELEAPAPELDWDEWFRRLLHSIRPVVAHYPGTAKWLLMHGPAFPAIVPVIDAGIAALRRAGFGERAAYAYAVLLNNATLTISMSDDRLLHEDDGPRDHAAMMREFSLAGGDSTAVTTLTEGIVEPFARGGDAAERERETYYRLVVETTIAGVAAMLDGALPIDAFTR